MPCPAASPVVRGRCAHPACAADRPRPLPVPAARPTSPPSSQFGCATLALTRRLCRGPRPRRRPQGAKHSCGREHVRQRRQRRDDARQKRRALGERGDVVEVAVRCVGVPLELERLLPAAVQEAAQRVQAVQVAHSFIRQLKKGGSSAAARTAGRSRKLEQLSFNWPDRKEALKCKVE